MNKTDKKQDAPQNRRAIWKVIVVGAVILSIVVFWNIITEIPIFIAQNKIEQSEFFTSPFSENDLIKISQNYSKLGDIGFSCNTHSEGMGLYYYCKNDSGEFAININISNKKTDSEYEFNPGANVIEPKYSWQKFAPQKYTLLHFIYYKDVRIYSMASGYYELVDQIYDVYNRINHAISQETQRTVP